MDTGPKPASICRREFMRRGSLSLASLAIGVGLAGAAGESKRKFRVGVQLYSVRDQCKANLAGTLAAVAAIGYEGVEFAGYHGHTAEQIRKLLDENGLVACGSHVALESLLEDKLDGTVAFNRAIGNKFLIVPWLQLKSKQEWLDKARIFNELADKLAKHGMFIGYHAHAHDFEKFDGVAAWDLFFGHTRPQVIMQLDTGNCIAGGADPVAVLRKYPGRARTIHLKAHASDPETVIGEDKTDWAGVFEACESSGGTEWYIVEHETSKSPLDAIKRSFDALRKLGKV
ncbi:MAG: sugar phosphate isomerase/epimerase [Verrucomicrobiae bacterium]|nr:sugar phosphate isomerase/epimerase [Verrucomicrobiae bacterium]